MENLGFESKQPGPRFSTLKSPKLLLNVHLQQLSNPYLRPPAEGIL